MTETVQDKTKIPIKSLIGHRMCC